MGHRHRRGPRKDSRCLRVWAHQGEHRGWHRGRGAPGRMGGCPQGPWEDAPYLPVSTHVCLSFMHTTVLPGRTHILLTSVPGRANRQSSLLVLLADKKPLEH